MGNFLYFYYIYLYILFNIGNLRIKCYKTDPQLKKMTPCAFAKGVKYNVNSARYAAGPTETVTL